MMLPYRRLGEGRREEGSDEDTMEKGSEGCFGCLYM